MWYVEIVHRTEPANAQEECLRLNLHDDRIRSRCEESRSNMACLLRKEYALSTTLRAEMDSC